MADLLLGVDVGTSAVKAGVFTPQGRLLGLGRAPYRTDSPHPGWAECDARSWSSGMVAALRDACQAASVAPSDVSAMGLGVLFPCVVPLDANARPLHPAILYSDGRSLAQVHAIEERAGRDDYEAAIGNRLMPGTCAVTSMLWLRDERPAVWGAARALGFANTAITARLTGEFCTDPTMAGLSGLADGRDPWHWSGALCERLGVDAGLLPRIVGSGEVVGTVTAAAARETGLRAGIPVVCGGGDVPVCALGAGALTPETCAYISGSTDCAAVPLSGPSGDRRWASTAYVAPDTWLGIGTNSSSGISCEWFARELLGRPGRAGLERMTELAAQSPPGGNGVIFLPYLQGERTPVWDPQARGMFFGLSLGVGLADLARAVFEGTAFALRQILDCIPDVAGAGVAELRAVGGGTRNDLWNQIKADVLGRRLDVLEFQETGALGAALLAGIGAGVYGTLREAIELARSVGGIRPVEADPARSALYDRLFAVYERLYPATAGRLAMADRPDGLCGSGA